jgi:ribosomal protein S18 acetylase RimI-like enzyme
MEIKNAKYLNNNIQEEICKLFVEGFGEDLDVISKNPDKLMKAFNHMFIVDNFYVCIINNEIAGMMACLDKKQYCIKHSKKILIKNLGLIKGLMANMIIKMHFTKYPKYTIEIGEETGSIEYVVTNTKYRKKGIATSIMNYIFSLNMYKDYILEVTDVNENAINVYKKLGFQVVGSQKIYPMNYLYMVKNNNK